MSAPSPSVTIMSFEFPPCDGGISRLCGALADSLHSCGTITSLITDARYGPRVTADVSGVTSAGPRRVKREISALLGLRRTSRAEPVLCGIWYPEGLLALIARVRPLVILAHGAELMPPGSLWRRNLWRKLQRWVLTSADVVVANSHYTRDLVSAAAPGSRVVAIPLGVDSARFAPGNREEAKATYGVTGKKVLCSVARLCSYKGHDVVLRALASLPDEQRDQFVYLVAGQGPDLAPLQRKAEQLAVDEIVRWLGFVPEGQLNSLYNASDLFVLCTREIRGSREVEGFGLAFLEAQACGVPVVGTRTGGIADAVREGEGGWLIDQDDDRALAAIFSTLVHQPERFRAAGRAARARIERECTWQHYFERFRAMLSAEGINLA